MGRFGQRVGISIGHAEKGMVLYRFQALTGTQPDATVFRPTGGSVEAKVLCPDCDQDVVVEVCSEREMIRRRHRARWLFLACPGGLLGAIVFTSTVLIKLDTALPALGFVVVMAALLTAAFVLAVAAFDDGVEGAMDPASRASAPVPRPPSQGDKGAVVRCDPYPTRPALRSCRPQYPTLWMEASMTDARHGSQLGRLVRSHRVNTGRRLGQGIGVTITGAVITLIAIPIDIAYVDDANSSGFSPLPGVITGLGLVLLAIGPSVAAATAASKSGFAMGADRINERPALVGPTATPPRRSSSAPR